VTWWYTIRQGTSIHVAKLTSINLATASKAIALAFTKKDSIPPRYGQHSTHGHNLDFQMMQAKHKTTRKIPQLGLL
jgi:hypothetical protein